MGDAFSVPLILSCLQPTRGFPVGILTIRKTKLQKKDKIKRRFHTTFRSYFGRETTSSRLKSEVTTTKNITIQKTAKGSQNIYVMVPEG